MSTVVKCDVCGNEVKTGYKHHANLKLMNPLQENGKGSGYVHEGGEADFCGKCLKEIMKTFRSKKDFEELERVVDFDF